MNGRLAWAPAKTPQRASEDTQNPAQYSRGTMEQRVPQPDGGQGVPCVTELQREGTDGRDFGALPGCLYSVGGGVGPGTSLRREGIRKVASRGPTEVGNRRLIKAPETAVRGLGTPPSGAPRPDRPCRNCWPCAGRCLSQRRRRKQEGAGLARGF